MTDTLDIKREASETKGRYFVQVDGAEAELTYTVLSPGKIIADHTGVPEHLRGTGLGLKLVERLVSDARSEKVKIVPLCSFVKVQADRHPEWADVFQ